MRASQEKIAYCFKIIIIGPAGAGKTCLFNRYCFNSFNSNTKETIGIIFHSTNLRIQFSDEINKDKDTYVINSIFDFAGQERFRPLIKRFIDGANGALLVFDSINSSSFENLNHWYEQLIQNAKDPEIPKLLIGSKSDLISKTSQKKIVSEDFVNKFVREKRLKGFFRTSALENYNILEVFKNLTNLILKYNNLNAEVV